jgi:hypothetical protein
MISNNITRMLEARKIPFVAFELPVEKLGAAYRGMRRFSGLGSWRRRYGGEQIPG